MQALNTADMACEMYCYRSIVDGERAQARFLKRLQEVPLPQELQGELQIDEAKQACVILQSLVACINAKTQ